MVTLRRAGKDDFALLQAMAIAFHGEDLPPPAAMQEAAALLLAIGEEDDSGRPARLAWVAHGKGGLVGYAVATRPEGTNGSARIEELYVAPPDRGRGVGRAVLGAVEQALDLFGCRQVVVTLADGTSAERLFYRSLGYEPFAPGEFAKSLA